MNFDFLNRLRMQNIFGGAGTEPMPTFGGAYNPEPMDTFGGTPPFVPDEAQPFDVGRRMRELYTPETESIDRFNEMIGQYPTWEKPGKLRNIGAIALASLGDLFGPKGSGQMAFNEMTGRGQYQRDIADWKNQIDPLERAANIERQSNVNNRTMAYQTVSQELRQRADEAKAANDAKKAQIAQQRADVYEFKARNPNLQFDFSTPWVMIKDPRTGQVVKATGTDGQPIPTGNMSDQDRLALTQQHAMERIQAQGDVASELEDQRQGNRVELAGVQGEQARRTRATPTGNQTAAGTRPELPTQTRVRQFIAAREVFNTRPDLRKFIKLGDPASNDFQIVPPGRNLLGATGPTAEQYAELNQLIYGNPQGPQQFNQTNVPPPPAPGRGRGAGPGPAAGGGNTAPMTKNVRNRQTGEVRQAFSYDGGKTWTFEQRR